jgi:hypothetical protein
MFKMYAIFKSYWVRKLIGKLGVPYNRRLRVRGSPHPNGYDAGLSLAAAESNAFRNQSGLPAPDWRIAALICFASGEVCGDQWAWQFELHIHSFQKWSKSLLGQTFSGTTNGLRYSRVRS